MRELPRTNSTQNLGQLKGTDSSGNLRSGTVLSPPRGDKAVSSHSHQGSQPSEAGEIRQPDSRNLGTSFAIAPGRELGKLQYVRKGKDRTLFVQSISDARVTPVPVVSSGANQAEHDSCDNPDSACSFDFHGVTEQVVGAAMSVVEAIPNILPLFCQPIFLVFVVLMCMLCCQAVCLRTSLTGVERAIEMQTYKNSQNLQVASHVTLQWKDMQEVMEQFESQLVSEGKNASQDDQMNTLEFELNGINTARRQSLEVLHHGMSYHVDPEDMEFLVNLHVDYEMRVKELATEEIIWLGVVTRNEHHRLHRRMERAVSRKHPLYRVSEQALQLSKKWMDNFYGDEELTQKHWQAGEEERRRIVADLGSQLTLSFDDVKVDSPSWRFRRPGESRKRSMIAKRSSLLSSRLFLVLILLALLLVYYTQM